MKAKDVPIKGFERYYKITDNGKVISLGEKSNHKEEIILKPSVDKNGYLRVKLQHNKIKKYISIHRLVAMAFIPNPNKKPIVNHIDRDVKNNNVSNLEWVDNYGNYKHSSNLGFGRKETPILQLDLKNNLVATYKSSEEAGRVSGVGQGNIINCCRGRCKSVGGFKWQYKKK
jgi:hypothetical protein